MRSLLLLLACACAPARAGDPYADHIDALRGRLAKQGLKGVTMRIEKPFVVIGNNGVHALERDGSTVKWAVEKLEADFFDVRPSKILDVYLFRDAKSYERGVKLLTGHEPSTPYGFYSRVNPGLYMNIATGGGTLVHEIVHPYVEADFPDAPPWLNEGLGSLFEQSAEEDGHIIGLTNWRLSGLQRAIKDDRVPTFQQLTHYDTATFYGDDSGVNYAASRYLLYYLQEQGKLRDFYKNFRAARKQDPSGYKTLVAALGVKDMKAFEEQWRTFVMALEYP